MKYLFASDIHGSAYYAEKVVKKSDELGAENIILMGDLLYHGARNDLPGGYSTKDTARILNEYSTRIIACRGNCDSEVDQMVLDFPMRSDYNILNLNGITFFQTHGHIYNPERMPPMGVCRAFVFGHIHLPVTREENGVVILNPGSTTIPKGGNPGSYAVLDGNVFTIYAIDDDSVLTSITI